MFIFPFGVFWWCWFCRFSGQNFDLLVAFLKYGGGCFFEIGGLGGSQVWGNDRPPRFWSRFPPISTRFFWQFLPNSGLLAEIFSFPLRSMSRFWDLFFIFRDFCLSFMWYLLYQILKSVPNFTRVAVLGWTESSTLSPYHRSHISQQKFQSGSRYRLLGRPLSSRRGHLRGRSSWSQSAWWWISQTPTLKIDFNQDLDVSYS